MFDLGNREIFVRSEKMKDVVVMVNCKVRSLEVGCNCSIQAG